MTDERTRTVVLIDANWMFSISVDFNHSSGPCTARVVKYIANNAAKNINSLDSQTIVPTATRFGLLILGVEMVALDMGEIIPVIGAEW